MKPESLSELIRNPCPESPGMGVRNARNFPTGLKLYSGVYKFVGNFWGHELLNKNELMKYIEITEQGDPITSVAYRHYDIEDSIKISFIIRNRISSIQTLHIGTENPFSFFFVSTDAILDTVLHKKFNRVPDFENEIILNSKSDLKIFSYKISKSDPELAGLKGAYDATFSLKCGEREIKASIYTIIH